MSNAERYFFCYSREIFTIYRPPSLIDPLSRKNFAPYITDSDRRGWGGGWVVLAAGLGAAAAAKAVTPSGALVLPRGMQSVDFFDPYFWVVWPPSGVVPR